VAIWIKEYVEFKLIDEYKENEGRLLLIYVEIINAIYTIINIDAPNNMSKRNTFFKQVDRCIKEHIIGQIIPAGDYDILSKIDTTKSYQCQKFDKPVLNLKSMIKTHRLIDIWRQKNKTKTQFTWNRKDKFEATRIDYFLVSTEILMNLYSCDIRPIVLKHTDHNSISLKPKLFKGSKGKGYWKLNTSILKNQEYSKSIEILITKYQHKFTEQHNLDIIWDNFKLEVRDKTIDHCKQVAKGKKK
jgi:exonuclease III